MIAPRLLYPHPYLSKSHSLCFWLDPDRNDNTEYSNQEGNELFWNPLLVKHAESLSSRSRPVNHATGTLWGKGE